MPEIQDMSEMEEVTASDTQSRENPYAEKFEGVPGSAEDLARFYEKCKCTEEEALTNKHIEWGWKSFGPEDGHALAHVVKNNKICITMDIFVNELFVDAGVRVAESLAHNTVLKTIDLQQAQIGVAGGKALAESLRVNKSLMNLKMHYNHLGPEGCAYICDALKTNKTLTNLSMSDNGIMREGVNACADMLQNNTKLMRLDLSKNAGLTSKTGNAETTAFIKAAAEKHEAARKAAPKLAPHDSLPFQLIMEDSPGQMWTPNGFVNIVKHPKQRRPKKEKVYPKA